MEEIKVGEYIRNKFGQILKIDGPRDMGYIEEGNPYFRQQIAKHSPNIIDLIEIGDYVNGSKVIDIAQGKIKAAYIESQEQKFALIPIVEKQIKSIVTKEQFASMEYKVKE